MEWFGTALGATAGHFGVACPATGKAKKESHLKEHCLLN